MIGSDFNPELSVSDDSPEALKGAAKRAKASGTHGDEEMGDGTPKTRYSLTVGEKARAAAMWRSGEYSLEQLSREFSRRPETLSRMFKSMGVEKGDAAKKTSRAVEKRLKEAAVSDIEKTLARIAETRDSHYQMSRSLALFAFRDIVLARQAGTDVAKLKDKMAVYKMASEVVGTSRKELWALLEVEKHIESEEDSNLPELRVMELTQNEIVQLQSQDNEDDLGMDMEDAPPSADSVNIEAMGGDMMELDDE